MHLLALGAFRPKDNPNEQPILFLSECTFWRSVLSDLTPER